MRGEPILIVAMVGVMGYWIFKKSRERILKESELVQPLKVYQGFNKEDLKAIGQNKKGLVYIDPENHKMYFAPYGKDKKVDYSRRVDYSTFEYVKKHPKAWNKLIPKHKIYHDKYVQNYGNLYAYGWNDYGFTKKDKKTGKWVIGPLNKTTGMPDWNKVETVDKFYKDHFHFWVEEPLNGDTLIVNRQKVTKNDKTEPQIEEY